MITNSFKILITKNLETYCIDFTITTFILFFRNISKIHNDKKGPKQVYSFHANADIKTVFTFLKKYIHEWKHSWSKDKQKLPLVDPLS